MVSNNIQLEEKLVGNIEGLFLYPRINVAIVGMKAKSDNC